MKRTASKLGAAALVWLLAASALAAEPAAQDLSRYKEEAVPGGVMLLAAYMAMWALAAVFVAFTIERQRRVEAALRALEDRLDRGGVA